MTPAPWVYIEYLYCIKVYHGEIAPSIRNSFHKYIIDAYNTSRMIGQDRQMAPHIDHT